MTNGYRFEGSIDAYDLGPESLAPDQSRFVFTTRLVDGYPYTYELYSAPIDGSEAEVRLHREVASEIHIELAGITSDSQSAVICGDIYGNGTEDIYRTPLAGGDPVLLSPSFEPDTTTTVYGLGYGDMAVYCATLADSTKMAIYSVPVSGGPSTELNTGLNLTTWPRAEVTPDRHFVLFEADDSHGMRNIYAVSVLGGDPVAIMEAYDPKYDADFYPGLQFSSDGRRVIYELDDSTTNGVYYNKTYVAGIPLAHVDQGVSVEGSITGGAGFIGGIDYVFDAVLTEGVFKAEYFRTPIDELDTGLVGSASFVLPGDTLQYWDLAMRGVFEGQVVLTFTYDENLLSAEIAEAELGIYHQFADGSFELLQVLDRDLDNNTITVSTGGFSNFVLGVVPEPGSITCLVLLSASCLMKRR